ncbi:hypothetical protein K469DRAFT_546205, partial [Zopfia rhizophila CBS 207.26]
KGQKTYNSWDSLVVTHPTTSQPVKCLICGERTGSNVLNCLWSYVKDFCELSGLCIEGCGEEHREDLIWTVWFQAVGRREDPERLTYGRDRNF